MEINVVPKNTNHTPNTIDLESFIKDEQSYYTKININNCIDYISYESISEFLEFVNKKTRLGGELHLKGVAPILLAKYITNGRILEHELSTIISPNKSFSIPTTIIKILEKLGYMLSFITYEYIYYHIILTKVK